MKVVMEFEGVIVDDAASCYAAHSLAAERVGWARLDQQSFWRLLRTQGQEAVFLRGAKPLKLKEYREVFDGCLRDPAVRSRLVRDDMLNELMRRVRRVADCRVVSLLQADDVARNTMAEAMPDDASEIVTMSPIPGLRQSQLNDLADGDRQRVLVATADALIRAGGAAEFITVGLSGGRCGRKRLEQAGASVIFRDLEDFADCLAGGGKELLEAGLLPFTAGE
ncbi:MAG: hypothetical protein ACPGXK_04165 [Phycisphaerae bacterium]